ncbi:glycoprotein-N-acetylgalactosamine 3-beta-galactosyltransferase 1 [Eurytemora carolleeae]|uniref:glycoprotein-N-acetylgalactosamine 3-beta-galactosyltransferase 1 n=1 Tax=Eurytemora carolleeae TaxID=1294199 RepID=UPI000C783554|nr:glycoprotein-N-acetylgalactosamine 3-beta-galactosyltransferase 1 [Eurytemora carolleeae]|eukprot:XP_023338414.1 glycoprotein-N-acetylgalactosamine 3-beta-galactosyltransferase 1-like [Eurytemora affinis]
MILGRMNRSVKVLLLLIFASLFIALFFDKISFEGDFSKSSKYISLNEIYLNRTHVLEKLERTILNQQISIQNLLNKSLQVLQEDLDNKDETIQSLKLQLENTRKLEGGPESKFQDLSKIRIGCIITTHPGVLSEFQALAVHDTWVRRCTKVLFVTSSGSPFLEKLNFTARSYFKASEKEEYSYFKIDMKEGRERLWAKTKISFAQAYFDFASEVDWFLKADDDSYIVMENLQYFLSSLDSSLPLLAGSLFMCRSTVKECLVDENHVKDQPYMSGGAGYVLSRTALELFVNVGIGNNDLCRDESLGPEDVQMSRCMENLGVHFVDTRDRFGKLRFIHIDLTDILR